MIRFGKSRWLCPVSPKERAYGGPSLHFGRNFLGRLREDEETLVLKVEPAERARLLENASDAFFVTAHYQEHPLVLVNLLTVELATLRPLIERAWRMVATKRTLAAYDDAARDA